MSLLTRVRALRGLDPFHWTSCVFSFFSQVFGSRPLPLRQKFVIDQRVWRSPVVCKEPLYWPEAMIFKIGFPPKTSLSITTLPCNVRSSAQGEPIRTSLSLFPLGSPQKFLRPPRKAFVLYGLPASLLTMALDSPFENP